MQHTGRGCIQVPRHGRRNRGMILRDLRMSGQTQYVSHPGRRAICHTHVRTTAGRPSLSLMANDGESKTACCGLSSVFSVLGATGSAVRRQRHLASTTTEDDRRAPVETANPSPRAAVCRRWYCTSISDADKRHSGASPAAIQNWTLLLKPCAAARCEPSHCWAWACSCWLLQHQQRLPATIARRSRQAVTTTAVA